MILLFPDNFLDGENWLIAPSSKDLARLDVVCLDPGVSRNVQELAIAIAISLQGCGLSVGVLQAVTFIERSSK